MLIWIVEKFPLPELWSMVVSKTVKHRKNVEINVIVIAAEKSGRANRKREFVIFEFGPQNAILFCRFLPHNQLLSIHLSCTKETMFVCVFFLFVIYFRFFAHYARFYLQTRISIHFMYISFARWRCQTSIVHCLSFFLSLHPCVCLPLYLSQTEWQFLCTQNKHYMNNVWE